MKTYSKQVLIDLLLINNTTQPKAKYSNNILLTMLSKVDNDFEATLEPTREGFAFNRGSLCECLIKYVINGKTTKAQATQSDLNTSKVDNKVLEYFNLPKSSNIEIKYSTSFSPATHKTSKARYTIIVSQNGIDLIESKNLIETSAGKININNQRQKDLTKLVNLESRLGLR